MTTTEDIFDVLEKGVELIIDRISEFVEVLIDVLKKATQPFRDYIAGLERAKRRKARIHTIKTTAAYIVGILLLLVGFGFVGGIDRGESIMYFIPALLCFTTGGLWIYKVGGCKFWDK